MYFQRYCFVLSENSELLKRDSSVLKFEVLVAPPPPQPLPYTLNICSVSVKRFPRPSPSMRFGDVTRAHRGSQNSSATQNKEASWLGNRRWNCKNILTLFFQFISSQQYLQHWKRRFRDTRKA